MTEPTRLLDLRAPLGFGAIREEYMAVTNGDAVAAALLDFFERFALWRRKQGYSDWEWVYISQDDLPSAVMGIAGRSTVKARLAWLRRDLGYLEAKPNPHSWNHKQLMYRLNLDALQAAYGQSVSIDGLGAPDRSKVTERSVISDPTIGQIQLLNGSDVTERWVRNDPSMYLESSSENPTDESAEQAAAATQARVDAREAAAAQDGEPKPALATKAEPTAVMGAARQVLPTAPPPTRSAAPPARAVGAAPSAAPAVPPLLAVKAFEDNLPQRLVPAIREAIAAACAAHGEDHVVRQLALAGKRGARSWAYVEAMLTGRSRARPSAWDDGHKYITGQYAQFIEH